ncbi:MAG: response regulator [Nitrospirota bacterium]
MDNRKEKRVLIKKEVVINDSIKAYVLDISKGGMYIYTQVEFITGAILKLSFDVDNRPIKIKAKVQHAQPGIGIGVKFIGLSRQDSIKINDLLERLHHVYPVGVSGKKKVLLVDNDPQSRTVYKIRLLQDDFTVIEASNGLEAFKLLQDSMPDIVVLDLWLDSMDGFKILQLMQMNPDLKMIPVLILSTRCVPLDIEKAMALGAKDYLLKMTTTPLKLSEKIRAILGSL